MEPQVTGDTVLSPTTDKTTARKGRAQRAIPSWKKLALRSLWLLLYPAAFISVDIMRAHPEFVERFFATGIFPAVRGAVARVFSVFPFSFAEFLLYSLIAALVVFAVVCVVLACRRKLALRRFLSWLLTILIIGGAGLNAFYWMWGFNYFREPLGARMELDTEQKAAPDELYAMCVALAEAANGLRAELSEDENGVFVYTEGKEGILAEIPAAYERLQKTQPVISGTAYPAKPIAASVLMSDAGLSGIFIPFTEESNVNVDDTPLLIAASAAHETAHSLGVASEAEANFTAFLACMASDDPQVQYSGLMLALIHMGNALASADKEAYHELWNTYSDAVRRDLAAHNEHIESHRGEVSEAVTRTNDRYLRGNGQESGVRSYGEMVDLLIAYIRQQAA